MGYILAEAIVLDCYDSQAKCVHREENADESTKPEGPKHEQAEKQVDLNRENEEKRVKRTRDKSS